MICGFFCNAKKIITISLEFGKNERSKKMILRFQNRKYNKSSFMYYLLPYFTFNGKYNKVKLNRIIEYEKNYFEKKIEIIEQIIHIVAQMKVVCFSTF